MPSYGWIIKNPEKYFIWKQNLSKARRNFVRNNPHFQDGSKNPMYGISAWNKGLTKEIDERVKKYAQTRKLHFKSGIIIPVWLGKKHSLSHRIKNSVAKRGTNNPMKRREVRIKVSKTLKKRWKTDKEFAQKMLTSFKRQKNKFEKEFITICKEYNLPFIYVGDGSFWVGPCISGKRRNPDFRHLTKKKVILLNGDYWHTKQEIDEQIKDYVNKGYEVFSIFESKWLNSKEDIIEKLKKFSN